MTIVTLMCVFHQVDCERHGAALQLQHHMWTDTSSVAGTVCTTGVAVGLQLGHPGVIMHDSNADACHHSGSFAHLTCCSASLQVHLPWASYGGTSGSDWGDH